MVNCKRYKLSSKVENERELKKDMVNSNSISVIQERGFMESYIKDSSLLQFLSSKNLIFTESVCLLNIIITLRLTDLVLKALSISRHKF